MVLHRVGEEDEGGSWRRGMRWTGRNSPQTKDWTISELAEATWRLRSSPARVAHWSAAYSCKRGGVVEKEAAK